MLFQANISSIMSSESQVKNIMEHIDEGLNELDQLEEKLERYDKLLQVYVCDTHILTSQCFITGVL